MIKSIFAAATLLVATTGCIHQLQVPQTGYDPVSGWSREVTSTAIESWRYAQMASNAYKPDPKGPPSYILGGDILPLESHDNDKLGFAYAIFEKRKPIGPAEIVIAFRGTENDTLQDWFSGNLLGRQNPEALKVFDVWRLRRGKATPIVVTGHSLGGALAIHVSLNRPDVAAYAFNASPRFWRRGAQFINHRISIVEYGEVLKAPRILGREADQLYTSIGCSRGNPIAQHSMRRLANCLTQISAWKTREAKCSLFTNDSSLPPKMPPASPSDCPTPTSDVENRP